MDYKNKAKVRKLLELIETEEKNLAAFEKTKGEDAENSMYLIIDSRKSPDRKYTAQIGGELQEYIISYTTKEIKERIERLIKELEEL